MTQQRRADLEQSIVEAIFDYYYDTGMPPTYREVADRVQSAHSNVWQAVKHLREGGFLRETATSAARSLVLSDLGIGRVTGLRTAHPAYLNSSTVGVQPSSAIGGTSGHTSTKPIKCRASGRKPIAKSTAKHKSQSKTNTEVKTVRNTPAA